MHTLLKTPRFEALLRRAFDRFYEALIHNPYLGDFLKEADLGRLKQQQLLNFLDSLSDDDAAFFERYRRLGSLHHDLGLPYVEYREAFLNLQAFLIEEGCDDESRQMREATYGYIQQALNGSAAGYLEKLLQKDEITLHRQIDRQIDMAAVKDHLYWIVRVISDIRGLSETPAVELDPQQCKFGQWLQSAEAEQYIENMATRLVIEQTHRDVHFTTRNLYRSIRRRDYHKILIDYIILVRQSMYLYSELNANVTQQDLIEKVARDSLTGLLNRRWLDEIFESEIRLHTLTNDTFSIAMFDLDYFKAVNDTFGYQAGDKVLEQFAIVLRANTRKTDKLFRYGGEEFLAIFPGTVAQEAFILAEAIRKAFEAIRMEAIAEHLQLSVSIGIAEFSEEHRCDHRQLINIADQKLYDAKQGGRNRTCL